jgi:hypothetical protein
MCKAVGHLLGALLLLTASSAGSEVVYDWKGKCSDQCKGVAKGTLTLADTYVPGIEVADSDFISFSYSSSTGTFQIPDDLAFNWIVVLGDSGPTTTIAETGNGFLDFGATIPDVNNNGLVAFFAIMTSGGQGVYLGDGAVVTTVVDSQGPFNEFRFPNVNLDGSVLFEAILNGDGPTTRGVYTGPNPATDKVIGPGDSLFGSTVATTSLSNDQALNNGGEVVFQANLMDGRNVIVKATPN